MNAFTSWHRWYYNGILYALRAYTKIVLFWREFRRFPSLIPIQHLAIIIFLLNWILKLYCWKNVVCDATRAWTIENEYGALWLKFSEYSLSICPHNTMWMVNAYLYCLCVCTIKLWGWTFHLKSPGPRLFPTYRQSFANFVSSRATTAYLYMHKEIRTIFEFVKWLER